MSNTKAFLGEAILGIKTSGIPC